MLHTDPLHAARLANLEGALCALLREATAGEHPNDVPDSITVELKDGAIDITYLRGGVPVGGEGL